MRGDEIMIGTRESGESRYDRYERRVERFVRTLEFVKKHRVSIILTALAIIACIFALMFFSGSITSGIVCDSLHYGEYSELGASAFLCDVKYQFSSDGESWSEHPPTAAGEYYVRAVTKNALGIERESERRSVTLLARELDISMPDISCEYGALSLDKLIKNVTVSNLAFGDAVSDIDIETSYDSWSSGTAALVSLKITDADGRDVSGCYAYEPSSCSITLAKRSLGVRIIAESKIYDGQPAAVGYVLSRSCADGDSAIVTLPEMPTDVGSYSIGAVSIIITDSSGEDVSERYAISTENVSLEISKRQLRIRTGSAEKIYDGEPLSCDSVEVISGSLIDFHIYTMTATGSRTAKGVSNNPASVKITDQSGKSVLSNYDIALEEGTLRIIPIELKYTTESAEKVYDATPLRAEGVTLVFGRVAAEHTVTAIATGERIDVGESANTLKVTVTDKSGRDVTDEGYDITVDEGILKITPRPITLESFSAQKPYDATPLTYERVEVVEGDAPVEGTTASVDVTGSQTEVGESYNTFTVKILAPDGTDVTHNYDITCIFGILKVTESDFVPPEGPGGDKPGGDEPGGDEPGGDEPGGGEPGGDEPGGDEPSGGGFSGEISNNSGALGDMADFSTVYANVYQDYKADSYVYLRAQSFGDYNGSGFDVASPYLLGYNVSTLEFVGRTASRLSKFSRYKCTLTVSLESGTPALIPYYSYGLEGSGFESFGDISPTLSLSQYTCSMYMLSEINAMSTKIYATDSSAEREYRSYVYDTYLQIPDSTRDAMLEIANAQGFEKMPGTKKITAVAEYVSNAGRYNLFFEPYPEGVDVAVYFLTTAKEGICQHFAASATMMYRALGIPARYTIGYAVYAHTGEWTEVKGKNAHAWVEVYVDDVGWIQVEVSADGIPAQSPDNEKTDIAIVGYSATKEYDGYAFEDWCFEKYVIAYGGLKEGHTLEVIMQENNKDKTAPGVYYNKIASVKILDENGIDVTAEYNVITSDGKMTINKRRITIATASATEPIANGTIIRSEYWLISGSLVYGHELYLDGFYELCEVGTAENIPKDAYITDEDGKHYTDLYDITWIYGTLTLTE